MAAMTPLEHRIVEIARGHGSLAELCEFVEYDPDVGRVPEHFRPRADVLRLVKALQSEPSPADRGPQRAPAVDLQGVDDAHLLYAVIKRGFRVTRPEGLSQAELRERLEHLLLSYGSQCVEADRALREVRDGKDTAQREVDYRNGLAQKAIDKLLEHFPDPQPAPAEGAPA